MLRLLRTRVANADPVSPSCSTMPVVDCFSECPNESCENNPTFTLHCTETPLVDLPFVNPFNVYDPSQRHDNIKCKKR